MKGICFQHAKSRKSKLGGESLSRLKFNCVVASCSNSARSDALKIHYLNTVRFDEAGVANL